MLPDLPLASPLSAEIHEFNVAGPDSGPAASNAVGVALLARDTVERPLRFRRRR